MEPSVGCHPEADTDVLLSIRCLPSRHSSLELQFSLRIRCHGTLNDIEAGKADRKRDWSLEPVQGDTLEKPTRALFPVQVFDDAGHGRGMVRCDRSGCGDYRRILPALRYCFPYHFHRGIFPACGNDAYCLHPSSRNLERIRNRLGKESRQGSALHAFDRCQIPSRHSLNLSLRLLVEGESQSRIRQYSHKGRCDPPKETHRSPVSVVVEQRRCEPHIGRRRRALFHFQHRELRPRQVQRIGRYDGYRTGCHPRKQTLQR